MEKEKNNKGLIVLVIALIIIILGLIGFIVYDKLLKNNDEKIVITQKTSESITTNDFNKNENIVNETKVNGNNKVNLSYSKNEKSTLVLSINDKKISFNDLYIPIIPIHSMILYNDYFTLDLDLENGTNRGFKNMFLIYDYNGNELFNKDKINIGDNRVISDSFIKLENNILEFVSEYQDGRSLFCSDNCNFYQIVKSKDLCDNNKGKECYTCDEVLKLGEMDYEITYQMRYIENAFTEIKKIKTIKYKDTDYYKYNIELGSCNN